MLNTLYNTQHLSLSLVLSRRSERNLHKNFMCVCIQRILLFRYCGRRSARRAPSKFSFISFLQVSALTFLSTQAHGTGPIPHADFIPLFFLVGDTMRVVIFSQNAMKLKYRVCRRCAINFGEILTWVLVLLWGELESGRETGTWH